VKAKPKPRVAWQTRDVAIEAHVHKQETMFLRVVCGKAEQDGKTWELSVNVGGQTPIVRLPDGRWVTFTWPALIDAANRAGAQGVGAVLAKVK
jgi:hypothetical protein